MPLGDWTIIESHASATEIVQGTTKYEGGAALRTNCATSAPSPSRVILARGNTALTGKIRTMARVDAPDTGAPVAVVFAMMSGSISISSSAYAAAIHIGAGTEIRLFRGAPSTWSGNPGLAVASVPVGGTILRDVWHAFELKWQEDQSGSGQILLTASYGADFDSLLPKAYYIDDAPLASPVGCGIAHVDNNLVANECFFDLTQVLVT